ncbi:MAG: GC-type dockerin domain-anchored protein [Phycisphaerales bacterium]|nr:GC-type dockerin domain-anchored protein [Phycisphaerales bacterium]
MMLITSGSDTAAVSWGSDPLSISKITTSSEYTPAQGFEGTDRFTYRLVTSVDGIGSLQIFSEPATVEIRVESGACSQADLAEGYGSLNFLDVSAFLSAFGANDPISDFNNDGQYNFLDVSQFLSIFSAGCP